MSESSAHADDPGDSDLRTAAVRTSLENDQDLREQARRIHAALEPGARPGTRRTVAEINQILDSALPL